VYPNIPLLPKRFLLLALALLACTEKLCSIMNTLAVERDWVSVSSDRDRYAGLLTALKVVVIAGAEANQAVLQGLQLLLSFTDGFYRVILQM
jgi:hypothetical protein